MKSIAESANVTLPLSSFQELQQQVAGANALARKLQEELIAARHSYDTAGRLKLMASALTNAMEIVAFGVGNLSPETTKGWPFDVLRTLALELRTLSDCLPLEVVEASYDLENFSKECESYEKSRS